MAQNSDINLYKAKTGLSAQTVVLAYQLRIVSIVSLVIVFIAGLSVAIIYTLLLAQKTQLETQRDTVTRRIIAQAKKETLVIETKDRLSTVSKIIKGQRPWVTILNTINSFVGPPLLLSFSGDETTKLHVVIDAPSVDAVVPVIQGAMRETLAKHLTKTILDSVVVGKDGSVVLTLSFEYGS